MPLNSTITVPSTSVSDRFFLCVGEKVTLEEFEALPAIMASFPLTFKSGRQRWTNFEVCCNACKRPVERNRTRGAVECETTFADPYRGGKSFTEYHIVAHALCPVCDKLTTAIYSLDENMVCSEIKNGVRYTFKMRKLTLWEKLMKFVRVS